MNTALGFVIGLLQSALALLGFVQQHPEVPQVQKDQAQYVAQRVITQTTQTLSSMSDLRIEWKTYTNKQFGYSVRYPSGWIVEPDKPIMDNVNRLRSSVAIHAPDNSQGISITVNEKKSMLPYEALFTQEITINGTKQTAYIFPSGYEFCDALKDDCSFFIVPIYRDGVWYELHARGNARTINEQWKDILSSFKFADGLGVSQSTDAPAYMGKYFVSAEGTVVFKVQKVMTNIKYSDFSCGFYERKQNCTDNYLTFTIYQGYKVYQNGKEYSLITGDFDIKDQILNELVGFDISTFKLVPNIDKVIEGTDDTNTYQAVDPSKSAKNSPDDPYKMKVLVGIDVSAKYYLVAERFGCLGDTVGCSGSQYIVREPSSISKMNSVSVPGMSKYTDSDFGFSFWYPSGWKITSAAVDPYSPLSEGTILKHLLLTGGSAPIHVLEFTSPTRTISISGGACGFCAPMKFYFDANTHTWMKQYPQGIGGAPDMPQAQFEQSKLPQPADVSNNTMGGLHIFNALSRRFGDSTVPLSARNFVFVYAESQGQDNIEQWLVKTILATDPSVATPVSVAEQMATIKAEQQAYAGQ